jgi:tetratricopeptide (TPR) repeat protein
LLKQTDALCHEKGRWQEPVMATLARSCLDNQLFTQSVAYYVAVIDLHKKTHPPRSSGDGTLSEYYTCLARAQAGLKDTPKAVDAASAAIVSWGMSRRNRTQALETLKQVLRESSDLGAFVARLDREAKKTGLVNPVVRKAVGQVYFDAEKYQLAAVQLQQAFEAQPNDAETLQLLKDCHDRLGNKEGVIVQLLHTLQLTRRDIKLYQELGRRLEALQRPHEAERAYTSIVEVLPHESEGHALLAEVRQGQKRWEEAIAHWEQVAQIRALEPEGLLKLAEAQIHARHWDQAGATLHKVTSRAWAPRFGDIASRVQSLKQQLDQQRKTVGQNK